MIKCKDKQEMQRVLGVLAPTVHVQDWSKQLDKQERLLQGFKEVRVPKRYK